MVNKKFYIVDIRTKQNTNLLNYINNEDGILSLTPYSSFLLKKVGLTFLNFHNIVSERIFHDKIIQDYKNYETIMNGNKTCSFLFREIASLITYSGYIQELEKYLNVIKKRYNITIYYITDSASANEKKINYFRENYLFNLKVIDHYLNINKSDIYFYKKNILLNKLIRVIFEKRIGKKIIDKLFFRKRSFNYDNIIFSDFFENKDVISANRDIDKISFNNQTYKILENTTSAMKYYFIKYQYKYLLLNFRNHLNSYNKKTVIFKPFTYLSNMQSFFDILLYRKNNIPTIFTQHGCYLYDHIFFKYNEIDPADINFVFNQYTKKAFLKYKSNNIYIIKSTIFNYKIKEEKKKYDYLYITHCTTYSHNAVYIDGNQSYYSMDANNIYERHKNIIELFGRKFKDKKICIKIQPGIMLGNMLYIPFLELSEKYKNIHIEFSMPIQNLIGKSKYIISDYFSSEFINRELHYKRDIILFNAAPLILPDETVEDMQKMFILVDSVEDLEEKIKNIEKITKDRIRYDDIIEYYSSKKCDTKKVVTEILENEIDART